jgi:hypothetical protein
VGLFICSQRAPEEFGSLASRRYRLIFEALPPASVCDLVTLEAR